MHIMGGPYRSLEETYLRIFEIVDAYRGTVPIPVSEQAIHRRTHAREIAIEDYTLACEEAASARFDPMTGKRRPWAPGDPVVDQAAYLLSDTDPAIDRSNEYTELRNAWRRMRERDLTERLRQLTAFLTGIMTAVFVRTLWPWLSGSPKPPWYGTILLAEALALALCGFEWSISLAPSLIAKREEKRREAQRVAEAARERGRRAD
jgi:hypothetical protein